ncbi:MAG: DMT family transporter [Rhodobacteraceae bacterium]|nr:DMT family transporter [Paracoccaceae bacterium]
MAHSAGPAPAAPAADRPMLGMAMIVGFCLLAPLGDGLAKMLGAVMPVLQVVTVRFAAQALLLAPIVLWRGQSLRMRGRVLRATVARSLVHVLALGLMFAALQFLPLADTIAIVFVMPFVMLLLGWAVLGEEVGPRRLGACVVGFAGTLLVMQPSFLDVGLVVVLPLAVAVLFAVFMLITRTIAREVDAVVLQAVSGMMASAVLLPALALAALFGGDGMAPVAPTAGQWGILAAMGLIGTFGHLLMTGALRHAPAATLAPMQYLEIPFATLIGWLFFADLPQGAAAAGIAVTVAAGLYVLAREHAAGRRPRAPTPPPAA